MLQERNFQSLIEQNESVTKTVLADSNIAGVSEIQTNWKMGFLDLQILSLLCSLPMTGYCLRKNLHLRFGIWISFGTLYPHLRFLERIQVLSSSSKSRTPTSSEVITYELTARGKMDLRRGLASFQNSINVVEELIRFVRE